VRGVPADEHERRLEGLPPNLLRFQPLCRQVLSDAGWVWGGGNGPMRRKRLAELSLPEGDPDGVGSRACLEFGEQVADVRLGCLFGNVKAQADLSVCASFGHQSKYLKFACAQRHGLFTRRKEEDARPRRATWVRVGAKLAARQNPPSLDTGHHPPYRQG
jgi:hypothetical protein